MAKNGKSKYANIEPIRGELGPKEALRRLRNQLWSLRGTIVLACILTLAWSSLNLGQSGLVALFVKVIEDTVKTKQQKLQQLNAFTALAFLAFAVRGVLDFGQRYTWSLVAQRMAMRLRNQVFSHLMDLSISFFDIRKTGQLMSVLSSDIPAVNSVLDAIQDSINAPVILVGGVGLLFWCNWKLAFISCVCLPATAFVIVRASKRIRSFQGQVQSNLALINEHAEETISGIRSVKSFANEDYEKERFDRRVARVLRANLGVLRTRFSMLPLVEYLGVVALALVLWIGGSQVVRDPDHFKLANLALFVVVLQQVGNAARNVGQISINLTAAAVAADRVFTLLEVRNEIREKPEAIVLSRLTGRVVFDRVDFAYSSGIPVLRDISFVMEPGEVVAIVGPTGSGKTTIASLIPRFYDISAGSIKIDGVDVRDCTLASLRRQIGTVPQDTALFAGTLRDNIAYGRLGASEEEIIAAAQMANAWEFIERLPDGLDTIIGERGTRLSGGQRQRIAIARAVLRDPRILILDEATSALDTQSEALVQDALQKLVRDRTTLVIAHRLSTIRNADKILVIKDGQIVEAGAHAELLRRGGIYSDLYNTQFRSVEEADSREPLE